MTIRLTMFSPEQRDRFISPHYMYTSAGDGKTLIVVSGVVVIDFKGETHRAWRRETFSLGIDIRGAIPANKALRLVNYVPFVTTNAVYNQAVANDSGHAVDAFRVLHPELIQGSLDLEADVAVRDSDAWLFRLGYHVMATADVIDEPPGPF